MLYFLIAGAFVGGWAILLVMAGERQRQLNELEIQQQVQEAEALQAARRKPALRKKAA